MHPDEYPGLLLILKYLQDVPQDAFISVIILVQNASGNCIADTDVVDNLPSI